MTNIQRTPVKVAWTFEVSGKNSLNIFSRSNFSPNHNIFSKKKITSNRA